LILRYSSRSGVWRGGLAASLGYHKWVPFPTPNSIAFSLSDAVVLAVPPGPILAVAVSHRKGGGARRCFCARRTGETGLLLDHCSSSGFVCDSSPNDSVSVGETGWIALWCYHWFVRNEVCTVFCLLIATAAVW
jgi:hypothetical protein